MHIKEPIPINKTYSLSQDHVHHKTKNTNSNEANMHFNIIEYIIKTTLSSSYNINKNELQFITS